MTEIGIILLDHSPERRGLGLALEVEELINAEPGFITRWMDLDDYLRDEQRLRHSFASDGYVFIAQASTPKLNNILEQVLEANCVLLQSRPLGLMVNVCDQVGEDCVKRIEALLKKLKLNIYPEKIILNKIHESFNSSYELTDSALANHLRREIKSFLLYAEAGNWKSRNELSETL